MPYVTPIEVYTDEPIVVENCAEVTIPSTILDETRLAFVPDSTKFIVAAAAQEALKPIIEIMKTNPVKRGVLCGTTAAVGSNDNCRAFSKNAQAVKQVLVQNGTSEERIACAGLGYDN